MSRLILIKVVVFVSLCIALSAAFECGLRKVAPRLRRVIDGEQSYDGQWPWLVALFRKSNKNDFNDYDSEYNWICGATLINEWTLVTAGHCTGDRGTARQIRAMFGRFDMDDYTDIEMDYYTMKTYNDEAHWTTITISEFVTHENYGKDVHADIAILILEEPVKFTDYIQPICLPSPIESSYNVEGTVVGYGQKYSGRQSTPHHATFRSISPSECLNTNERAPFIVSLENSFCAKSNTSVPCRRDGGGPFMVQDEDTLQWKLFGIISYAFNKDCNPNDYTVFTDVTKLQSWISDSLVMFSCSESVKISMLKVCDGREDCDDGSDERHCVSGVKELWKSTLTFYIPNHEAISDDNYGVKATFDLQVEGFYLKNNKKIKFLPIGAGAKFPNLKKFHAESCVIQKITFKNLMRLTKLEKLNLGFNRIQLIEEKSFLSLNELTSLWLNNNLMTKVDGFTLKLLQNLMYLDLSFNQISCITVDAFEKLSNLTELSLKFNQLFSIPSETFYNNRKLQKLDLSFNEIEELSESLFLNLRKLAFLDLSENKLSTLQPYAFINLRKLKVIFLNHNNLKTLETDFNHKLVEIHLHDNKIENIKPNILKSLSKLRFVSLKDNKCIDKNFGDWIDSDFNQTEYDEYDELEIEDYIILRIKPVIFNDLSKLRIVSLKDNKSIDKNFGDWLDSDFNQTEFDEEIKACN